MQFRYTVTLDDYIAYQQHALRKSGVGRVGFLILWLGIPLLCGLLAVLLLLSEDFPMAVALLIVGAFWLFTMPSRYREGLARNTRAIVRRLGGRGLIGERLVVFSEESLIVVSETYRIEARWENIASVDVVGDRTFVFVAGLLGLILPREGFDTDEEYEAARDFALRKFEGRSES